MTATGWPIATAPAGIDPFLAATLWLLERGHWAIIAGPEALGTRSVHAKTLLENVLILNGNHFGPLALQADLGIVLAAPSAAQLEGLHRSRFHPTATWFLILSQNDPYERELQQAWLWAHSRPEPDGREGAASEPLALLSDIEVWALSLRAGRDTPRMGAQRRARMRLIPGGRS